MESSRRSGSADDVKPSAAGLPSAFDFNPFAPPDYAAYGQPPPHLAGGGGDADMADDYASGTGAFHLGPHEHEPPDAGDEGDCKRPRLRLGPSSRPSCARASPSCLHIGLSVRSFGLTPPPPASHPCSGSSRLRPLQVSLCFTLPACAPPN